MNKKNIENNQSELPKIIHNVIVIYSNDIEEHFEAIQITNNGIIIGRFIKTEFVPFGFIQKNSYKKINKILNKKTKN
jgi:hypothetical protein